MPFTVIRLLACTVFLGVVLSSTFSQELRVWHDRNGQEIRAILRNVEGEKVLMLKDGKEFFFDISILSDDDQAYV